MPKKVSVKYIGEGSYGCVVKPEIACSDTSKPLEIVRANTRVRKQKLVSKIFSDKESFEKEIQASQQMKKIDPSGTKFLLPRRACQLSYTDIVKYPETNQCNNIVENPQEIYYQLHMPYGGVKFDHAIRNKTYKAQLRPKQLLQMMKPLFKALVMLDEHKMCHMDIKPGNVLVTPQGEPIIIDYSLVRPYKDIYILRTMRRFRMTYYPYPPEFKILGYSSLINGRIIVDQDKCLKSVVDNYDHHSVTNYFKYFSENDISAAIEHDINHIQSVKDALAYMSQFSNRIDIYSVGMLMVYVTKYLELDFDPITNSDKDRAFIEFVKQLVHPQVALRATPVSAMKLYSTTMKKLK